MRIKSGKYIKSVASKDYNYTFDKQTGYFARWGKTKGDDPVMAPAFEILDWEISTICDNNCPFCYKSNVSEGKTIDISTFGEYLTKLRQLNPLWCQTAFGVGSLRHIPEIGVILHKTRSAGIIPNITISCHETWQSGIEAIKTYCGACAVSNYHLDKTLSLADYLRSGRSRLAQVNVHQLLSKETLPDCFKLLQAVWDLQLQGISPVTAIVFLWVKPKGRALENQYHPVSQNELNLLIETAVERKIGIGFDSCSAPFVMQNALMQKYAEYIEPCESTLFSAYLDVDGMFYPCSFCADTCAGVPIQSITSIQDLWESDQYITFRERLLKNNRSCPIFRLGD